jgi:hypothetical protein
MSLGFEQAGFILLLVGEIPARLDRRDGDKLSPESEAGNRRADRNPDAL